MAARIDSVEASDAPADLRGALAAAADALRDRKNPLVILVGDGAYPPDPGLRDAPVEGAARTPSALDLSGIDLRFVPVGKRADNVGIVAFNVRRYIANKSSYEVFLEVENAGPNPAQAKLTLFAGDAPVDRAKVIALVQKRRNLRLAGADRLRLEAKMAEWPLRVQAAKDLLGALAA